MIKFLKLLFLLFFCSMANAQELCVTSNGKGKMGVVDNEGNEVISCTWDEVTKWGRVYKVNKGKKYGLYDSAGQVLVPVECSDISPLNCWDRALICIGGKQMKNANGRSYMLNGKYGIVNGDGTIIIPAEHKTLLEFAWNGSMANILTEGKLMKADFHYIGDTLVTDCKYLGYGDKLGLYHCGILDGQTGRILLPKGQYKLVMEPHDNMVRTYNWTKNQLTCGYYDIDKGSEITVSTINGSVKNVTNSDIKYWTHGDFTGDIAPVNDGETWKFVDRTGNTVRSGYNNILFGHYAKIWMARTIDGNVDFFDESNKPVEYLAGYKDILFPKNETDDLVFPVKNAGNKWGVIDNSGQLLAEFDYDMAGAPTLNCVPVNRDGKWGCLDFKGKSVIPCNYVDFLLPVEINTQNFFVKKADNMYYVYDIVTQSEGTVGYAGAGAFRGGLAWVRPNGIDVPDNNLNRGLMGIINGEFDKYKNEFGFIINTNDKVMFPELINAYYFTKASERIRQEGRALTKNEAKKELLEYSKKYRKYNLSDKIDEYNWDY